MFQKALIIIHGFYPKPWKKLRFSDEKLDAREQVNHDAKKGKGFLL